MERTSQKKRNKDPQEAKWLLGHCDGAPVYVSLDESTVLLGPARSGKGVGTATEDQQ